MGRQMDLPKLNLAKMMKETATLVKPRTTSFMAKGDWFGRMENIILEALKQIKGMDMERYILPKMKSSIKVNGRMIYVHKKIFNPEIRIQFCTNL